MTEPHIDPSWDMRYPETLEELLGDCMDANANPETCFVVPGNALMAEMAARIIALENAINAG